MRKFSKTGKKILSYALATSLALSVVSTTGFMKNEINVKAADTGFTSNDFLKVNGTYVRNNYGKGNNIYLRGTNIGNLFVQESWMSSTDVKDQKTLLETLTNRFGQDKALELIDFYESNYFTTADLDNCKNMGMSVIRVPFTYMNLYKKSGSDWVLKNDAFTRLDWIVDECSKRGIYVILDLHGAFGSQSGQDHSGEVIDNVNDVTFFSNETLMSKTLDMWKAIASHYRGNPAVAAYDTLNEPGEKAGSTGEKHWKFYNRMYDAIRSVDPDHIIIMESCWGTSNLPNPSKYGWTNIMYEYHHYTWNYVDDNDANYTGAVNAINNLVTSVNNANYGVPTYIGEFNCFDGDAKWQYVLDKMNNAGWHYTNWSYKARGMGSWGIYHEKESQGKVDPASDSESTIRTKWGAGSVGTNNSSTGVTYNNMKPRLPGTVVFADKALTDADYFAIKANINNKYVCADEYGQSKLLADRDSYSAWEEFRVIYNSDGTISFQSRSNNKYLCAIFDDTDTENPIKARSNKISDWEKFYLEKNSDGSYSLRTYTNNKYVQADINDATAGILHATSDTIGTWERFTFVAVSDESALPGNNTQEPTTQEPATESQPQTSQATETIGTSTTKYGNDFKVVGYYPNWYGDFTSKVKWDKLTHAYYAFGLPSAQGNGTINSLSGEANNINAMIRACNNNDVVPVLSVGGWSHSGVSGGLCKTAFEMNTDTTAKCQALANNIVTQALQYGFKGIDIDWEYPTSSTQAQYKTFMTALRNLCNENNMILTVAVAATSGAGFSSDVLNMLDFVNIMAYDGNSGSGHSPYSLATQSFTYWNQTMGVPAKKLVIGVPFYERPNWASYEEIVAKDSANAQKDSAVINGTTVYYNGVPTMKQKAEYAANNAGGVMIWEISQDTTNESLSLMKAIYDGIYPIVGSGTTTEPTVSEVPGTVKVDSYAAKTDSITFTTNNGVTYAGGLNNNYYLDYYIHVAKAGDYTLTLNLAAGDTQWNASDIEIKINDNSVATLPITASTGWETFVPHNTVINFAANGTYKLTLVTKNGACNITDFSFAEKTEVQTETPTETHTEKPTETQTQHTDDVQVEINGFQISVANEGVRTIYSVSESDSVVSKGVIYGLKNSVSASDLYVGSPAATVHSYEATAEGAMNINVGNIANATSYTMTMRSVKTAQFYNTELYVRAYAKLKDGSYVYSDVANYSVYHVADILYKNRRMNSIEDHNYLYTEILSNVNSNYNPVDYNWNDVIVNF